MPSATALRRLDSRTPAARRSLRWAAPPSAFRTSFTSMTPACRAASGCEMHGGLNVDKLHAFERACRRRVRFDAAIGARPVAGPSGQAQPGPTRLPVSVGRTEERGLPHPFWEESVSAGKVTALVTCPSGRRCNTRNVVWCKSQRGFKSHRHRQLKTPASSPMEKKQGFCFDRTRSRQRRQCSVSAAAFLASFSARSASASCCSSAFS